MESKPSWQGLGLRILYLALGGLLTFLFIENRFLRAERDELRELTFHSLSIIEKTNSTSSSCLETLADIRKQLYPALWDVDRTNPFPATAVGGPKEQRMAAFK